MGQGKGGRLGDPPSSPPGLNDMVKALGLGSGSELGVLEMEGKCE